MATKTNYSSSVTANGTKLVHKKNRGDALASAIKLNQKIYTITFGLEKGETKSKLSSIAKKLNSNIEIALIKSLGGGKIQEGKGGFFPDFYVEAEPDTVEEIKAVAVTEQEGRFKRTGKVNIAGGEGITIKRGRQELVTGFGKGGLDTKAEVATTRFVNSLIKNKDNSKAIFKLLDGRGKAAQAVRASLSAKVNFINIPIVFQGALQNRKISFPWSEIRKAVSSGGFKFKITEVTEGVKLQAYFTGGTITKALNAMDKVIIKELKTGELGKSILKVIAALMALPSAKGVTELKQFTDDLGLSKYAMEYIETNSALISRGTIASPKNKKSTARQKAQQFISTAQLSALVKKRMGQIMPKGPRRGPPLSPNVLTERSGDFRSSVQVIPNYRKNMMSYFYDPKYGVHRDTDRNPDLLVQKSIREVVIALFSRQFAIVRGF